MNNDKLTTLCKAVLDYPVMYDSIAKLWRCRYCGAIAGNKKSVFHIGDCAVRIAKATLEDIRNENNKGKN